MGTASKSFGLQLGSVPSALPGGLHRRPECMLLLGPAGGPATLGARQDPGHALHLLNDLTGRSRKTSCGRRVVVGALTARSQPK